MSAAAAIRTEQADELGEQIVAAGFAASGFLLDINGALDVPRNFPLPAPWNLPSRLFQFPIEVIRAEQDEPRKIGLRHPLLAAHPFVQHVERVLGVEIAREGVTNRYGYSNRTNGLWHHAVDLISAGKWRELLDTQEFTEPSCIFQAVVFGCRYSNHGDSNGRGHINTAEARQIMSEMGGTEPADRSSIIRTFSAPSMCKQDSGSEHWPINTGRMNAEDQAWAFIHGIEDGWFAHDRSGHLQWTPLGRDRYAAGDSASFTEASGQTAFAF
ncbi:MULTISPECIES: hypothetical protein [Sphingomonadales]|uniref:Uncharacterized protein n=5 Tax=Sphingomonadales TaxID=204457 RepID=A0A8E1C0Z9_9SPHN|nr:MULTISPECIES: hypothetical protein [Sphingomonadaceae]EPR12251.1 hypothetical protein M527_01730 [Sphingobium indicum IP26]QEH80995.1 hypothetical protein EIK56_24005 [Sphingomonas sp. C8-2]AMK20714.1 hypothetical protein K663_21788 [Sphingobium sp. MI1205]EQB08622.1 hypothetical protein L286_01870 [Sphingobium sp. HDIP04]EQB12975.1 hypothetical protein RLDS_17915 [Sphingobium lactosutens DS20]